MSNLLRTQLMGLIILCSLSPVLAFGAVGPSGSGGGDINLERRLFESKDPGEKATLGDLVEVLKESPRLLRQTFSYVEFKRVYLDFPLIKCFEGSSESFSCLNMDFEEQALMKVFFTGKGGRRIWDFLYLGYQIDLKRTGACRDRAHGFKDGSASLESYDRIPRICLSAERILKKVSKDRLRHKVTALIAHELVHVLGGDEKTAVFIQNQVEVRAFDGRNEILRSQDLKIRQIEELARRADELLSTSSAELKAVFSSLYETLEELAAEHEQLKRLSIYRGETRANWIMAWTRAKVLNAAFDESGKFHPAEISNEEIEAARVRTLWFTSSAQPQGAIQLSTLEEARSALDFVLNYSEGLRNEMNLLKSPKPVKIRILK